MMVGVRLFSSHKWINVVDPGRSAGTFLFLCAWLYSCHWDWLQYKVIILPLFNVLQWRWPAYVYLGWIDETICLALDDQYVRLYCFVFDFGPVIPSLIQRKVVISTPFPAHIHYNADGRRVLILVALMEPSRWSRTTSKYVVYLSAWNSCFHWGLT